MESRICPLPESMNEPGTSSGPVRASGFSVKHESHHDQQQFCYTRAPYRQGREFKAVKVYTINDESKHMLLHNIPNIGLAEELKRLCQKFGTILDFRHVQETDYAPKTPFTTVFYVKYESVRAARYAKTKLDNRAFYGEVIHICYAPELESIEDAREKLHQRAAFVQSYRNRSGRRKR